MASSSDFYVFRSEFVRSFAYSQFIQRLFLWVRQLRVIRRTPNNDPESMTMDLKTGGVTLTDVRSNYTPTEKAFAVVDKVPVPFRVTYPDTDEARSS